MSTTAVRVPYISLGLQHRDIKAEILKRVESLLDSGQFILGEELQTFERSFAELHRVKYALGVANGTDALFLSLMALGIGAGDEVITAPNSFLASASAIALAGAKIVFADVREDFNLDPVAVEKAITPKTKAIIAVHLTGRPAPMNELSDIARRHTIEIVEDCAQAVLATYEGQPVGSFGATGCFSLHPLKNLAACGDGGVITTSREDIYHHLLKARNHGLRNRDECAFWSYNSRLDNLQAAILNVKLNELPHWTIRRREIAGMYQQRLSGVGDLIIPQDKPGEKAVYHTFIIQTEQRDALRQYLEEQGIDTKIHYPIAIHRQDAAKDLGYAPGSFPITERQARTILSLPVYAELTDGQVEYVAKNIIAFFERK